MQSRAGVVGAGEAATAEADGRHAEVAAVLLDEQVGRGLGDAEQRVRRGIYRHRRVDPAKVAVVRRKLEPVAGLDQRQLIRQVAIHLVRRAEDERGRRRMAARRLEQVQRPVGVDREVGLRIRRGPVVRRLRRGVDHELERAAAARRTRGRRHRRRGCRSRANGTSRRACGSSRSVVCAVDADGPKNRARMSFSSPITSKPASTKCWTDSDPISPPEPVTIAVGIDAAVKHFCALIVRRS